MNFLFLLMRVFAIVGRPNVGKSTLFNRLLGKYRAIVHDQPGVTRDWQIYEAELNGQSFTLYDTPGLCDGEPIPSLKLPPQGWVWVLDGQEGLTSTDYHMMKILRKQKLPVILVANKCERQSIHQDIIAEFTQLGWGSPVMIAAKHGLGIHELVETLIETVPNLNTENAQCEDGNTQAVSTASTTSPTPPTTLPSQIIVTVIGRPNVGKSTLVNRFLGYDRMTTGPQAGITTDAVQTSFVWKQHPIVIVDTAGLRRKTALRHTLEHLSCRETQRALIFTHVALVVIDASVSLDRQDLVMVDKAWQEGRGVIVVLNKWDQVAQPNEYLRDLPPSIARHRVCTVSGLTGLGLDNMWGQVIDVYHQWNHRLPTGPLNRWLMKQVSENPPPMIHGHRIKLKYITQTKSRPPTFALFGSCVKDLPPSYQRYLLNRLAKDFDLPSSRLILMNAPNPYHTPESASSR